MPSEPFLKASLPFSIRVVVAVKVSNLIIYQEQVDGLNVYVLIR